MSRSKSRLLVVLSLLVAIVPLAATPATAVDGLNPGDLVINEIMQNPAAVSDSNGEWFEVFNTTGSPIDMNGLVIQDDGSNTHTISSSVMVPAGGFAVLGRNSNSGTNGGVTVDYQYSSFTLANGDDEVLILHGLTEIDRVNYDGGPSFPDPTGASMALNDLTNDNNDGSNWCTSSTAFGDGDLGTPGATNDCPALPPPPVAKFIHDVQGSGSASPIAGTAVIIEGVVVGDFQGNAFAGSQLGGFFVQEEAAEQDADPLTSEGIFVFAPSAPDVADGDLVEVTGTVDEFFGMTQITSVVDVTIKSAGNPLPPITPVSLPVTDTSDFEPVEGMLVTFAQDLFISEYFNFDRFGEIVLTTDRQFQPTEVEEPGSVAAAAVATANALARITLDDGRTSSNPDPAIHPDGTEFTLTNTFRGGDILQGVTGVVSFAFGRYRIQPTQGATHVVVNPRPTVHEDVGGDLKVASFNVLNFFTTLDQAPNRGTCGPTGLSSCRGADNQTEFDRQLAKLVAGIIALDADIIGLQEVENDIRDDDANGRAHDPILTLVEALNAAEGAGTWAWIGEMDTYNDYPIRNEIIYRTDEVAPVGGPETIADFAFDRLRPGDFEPVGRPPVAQTFFDSDETATFTVVVNHFKSKGSSCSSIGDPFDTGGAGNCNLTRVAQAEAVLGFVADLKVSSGDNDVLVIGDLNSYAKEDPVDVIKAGGFTDLVELFEGSAAYTFVFDGQLGTLDHALASASLLSQVTGLTTFDINVDEPDILDYDTSFKKAAQDALYEPLPYRVSDHDPVIIGLDFSGLQDIIDANPGRADKIEDALSQADKAREEFVKSPPDNQAALGALEGAIGDLQAAVDEGLPGPDEGARLMDILAAVARQVAVEALDEAIARGGDADDISDAKDSLAEGDDLRSSSDYKDALNKYKDALSKAEGTEGQNVDLQFLTVSDWHAQLDPLFVFGEGTFGGAAELSTYFQQERAANPNTLTLTAGDAYGAAPPLSSFFDEEPAVRSMRLMGFDADTLGNHNFDGRIEGLQNLINIAGAGDGDEPGEPFQYVSANLKNRDDNLEGVEDFVIFDVDDVKVAVIGVTNPEAPTLVFPGSFGTIEVTDPVAAANAAREEAAGNGAELFVLLAHMGVTGFDGDGNPQGPLVDLANGVNGFQLIIGDHTNFEFGAVINGALVVENQSRGRTYARINMTVREAGDDDDAVTVVSQSVTFVDPVSADVTPDPAIVALLDPLRTELDALLSGVIGQSTVPILRSDECGQSSGRHCESLIGNVVADAMRDRYSTDFAITNSGGLRANLTCPDPDLAGDFCPAPDGGDLEITDGTVLTVLPFGNSVVTLTVTGAELEAHLERGVSAAGSGSGRFAQVSGLCFTYDIEGAVGSRVTAVFHAPDGTCTADEVDLSPGVSYTLAENDFMASGGDGYPKDIGSATTRELADQVVAAYITANTVISPAIQGRITCTDSVGANDCPVPVP